jgi:hypothetical protein
VTDSLVSALSEIGERSFAWCGQSGGAVRIIECAPGKAELPWGVTVINCYERLLRASSRHSPARSSAH